MGGKKEGEGQPPKLTAQNNTDQHSEGASHAVRLHEESRGYDRSHKDLVAAFRHYVHERQEHFRRAGAPVDTPEGFIRERLEEETRTWGRLLRDRAGSLEISAVRLAFSTILAGVETLLNPMPVQAAAS